MHKFGVQLALEELGNARGEWNKARVEFFTGYNAVLKRLLHEAARNFMPPSEIATLLGTTPSTVRRAMREAGLDPRKSRTALSEQAAKALVGNAELLGITPHEMDLTSPLAYLPMGDQLKRRLQERTLAQVTELPVGISAAVGAIIAEETACGYCDGSCGSCQETTQKIINLVWPAR